MESDFNIDHINGQIHLWIYRNEEVLFDETFDLFENQRLQLSKE